MPRKALRCVAEITLHAVTCPGVWLTRRDDVYVRLTLFGQVRHTQLSSPIFPLLFHEKFKLDKVFYTAFEPSQVADRLEDVGISFEVIQLSDMYEGGRLLARYESNARDFLYPYPSYSPTYGTQDREVLLERSLDFPGIAPKLEFSTKTIIKETAAPYDPYVSDDDSPLYSTRGRSSARRSRSRSRSRKRRDAYHQATVSSIVRSRSLSPSVRRRLQELNLTEPEDYADELEERPPFVVRKCDSGNLIGRNPGSPAQKYSSLLASGQKSYSGYSSYTPGTYSAYLDDYRRPHGYSPRRIQQVVREPGEYPYPVYDKYSSRYSDDPEWLDLSTSIYSRRPQSYYTPRRPTSPLLGRSSLRDRFDDRPWSTRDMINDRVDSALRRNRSYEGLDRLSSSYNTHRYSDSCDDDYPAAQALSSSKSRLRREDLTNIGEYWRRKDRLNNKKNYRDVFNSSLEKVYSNMSRKARTHLL